MGEIINRKVLGNRIEVKRVTNIRENYIVHKYYNIFFTFLKQPQLIPSTKLH